MKKTWGAFTGTGLEQKLKDLGVTLDFWRIALRPGKPLAFGVRDAKHGTPHLDGAYARVGRAEGDWSALAEGDVIQDVRVEPE